MIYLYCNTFISDLMGENEESEEQHHGTTREKTCSQTERVSLLERRTRKEISPALSVERV